MQSRFVRYMLIWLLLLATIYLGEGLVRSLWLVGDVPRVVAARGELAPLEQNTIALFENASPSVAYIFTEGAVVTTPQGRSRQNGAGSGFVWDAAGHVVTNFHVVDQAKRVRVRLFDGTTVEARVVGTAPDHDLAVVRLADTRAGVRPIPIGRSADLKVGQSAYAIGNPYGLARTLTTGVVSALDRRLPTASHREIAGVIQTDAAINPGNSGGPLLDSAGRLIGVNTAIISESGSAAGIGFAVPVDTVNRVVPALIRDGRVPRPGIGISALPEDAAPDLPGIGVERVLAGSPAAGAGLRGTDRRSGVVGDVIVAADGVPVRSLGDLALALERAGIGKTIELTVLRDGQRIVVRVPVVDITGR
ncbi:MAG: trypsin-like peptidase domain-containing protein [Alphaproteobacteria bacterium]|nr:trypsin-like peptidase domain-containing protein [Alphaproteobacteria bacterium]